MKVTLIVNCKYCNCELKYTEGKSQATFINENNEVEIADIDKVKIHRAGFMCPDCYRKEAIKNPTFINVK